MSDRINFDELLKRTIEHSGQDEAATRLVHKQSWYLSRLGSYSLNFALPSALRKMINTDGRQLHCRRFVLSLPLSFISCIMESVKGVS